jgi:hypothetical protein
VLLVERLSLPSTLAQAVTLVFAFVARFCFVSLVVYGPARPPRRVGVPVQRTDRALPSPALGAGMSPEPRP